MGRPLVFHVYLGKKHIDTVFYYYKIDTEDVKKSLINHDGYDPRIEVKKRKQTLKGGK